MVKSFNKVSQNLYLTATAHLVMKQAVWNTAKTLLDKKSGTDACEAEGWLAPHAG